MSLSSGNKRGSIAGQTGDHMIEMIPPISRLGKSFVLAPIQWQSPGNTLKVIGMASNSTRLLSSVQICCLTSFPLSMSEPKALCVLGAHDDTVCWSKCVKNGTERINDKFSLEKQSLWQLEIPINCFITINCTKPCIAVKIGRASCRERV